MNVYVTYLARELAKTGCRVDIYTRSDRAHGEEIVNITPFVRVVHVEAGPVDEPKHELPEHVPSFVSGVEAFRSGHRLSYELIHSHYWLSGIAGSELSTNWGVPHVTMFHTTALTKMLARNGEQEPQGRVESERSVMADANAIIVSTEQERSDVSRLYGTDPGKISVLPAGVDLELFRPAEKPEARRSLGLPEGNVVLSVGRVEPLKGFDILLMAMASMDERSDTTVVIAGGDEEDSPEFERLRELAQSLGLGDSVIFTGSVSQDELSVYYNAADVFVLPSYYESFGLVALEAMACGVPVIASRVSGPRSFVKSGETGYLIDRRCPEPFAQRLDVLLHNPMLRESMGRAARSRAEELGWDAVGRRTLDGEDSV
ncbi:MAG: glycosyltransferase, partial [Chloroflexi bacterium]|nr:glycosyltransferase [Chloroflexota bacterium]